MKLVVEAKHRRDFTVCEGLEREQAAGLLDSPAEQIMARRHPHRVLEFFAERLVTNAALLSSLPSNSCAESPQKISEKPSLPFQEAAIDPSVATDQNNPPSSKPQKPARES